MRDTKESVKCTYFFWTQCIT